MTIYDRDGAEERKTLEKRVAALERRLTTPGDPGYAIIETNGIDLLPRKIVNFINATVVDNPTWGRTDVTASAASYAAQVRRYSDGPNTAFGTTLRLPFANYFYTDGVGALLSATSGAEGIVVSVDGVWCVTASFALAANGGIGGVETAQFIVPSGGNVVQVHSADEGRGFNFAQDMVLLAGQTVGVSATMATPASGAATTWKYDASIPLMLSAHYVGPFLPPSCG